MAEQNLFDKQIQNRNFLSPAGFKFTLQKAPKVDFFSKSVSIPNLTLGAAVQSSYFRDIPVPGDKLQYGDLDNEEEQEVEDEAPGTPSSVEDTAEVEEPVAEAEPVDDEVEEQPEA